MCHQFHCDEPKTLEIPLNEKGRFDLDNGKMTHVDKFAVGALTGIEMALDAVMSNSNGAFKGFQFRDRVTFKCTGIAPAERGQNPMPEFTITIDR